MSNETGGRMAFLGDDRILLTIGDHSTPESLDLARTDRWLYGSTVAIRRDDWSASLFTTGHRNPQGLLVENGRIWSTEHGPHGGDELNLLVEGHNYGWPRSTYGTAYGQKDWFLTQGPKPHSVGTQPLYAWVPSIGVSNLIRLRGTMFTAWEGDLLVASLNGLGNGYALFRVHVEADRVVVVEKLATKRAVRDLLELDDGRLLLWDSSGFVQLVEPATHVFGQCSGCHAVRWTSHGIGPDLMGVVGQRIAVHTGYRYSEAFSQLDGRWTRQRLDAFLRDPQAFAPGTTMEFGGVSDPEQRREIIEYLAGVADEN